jgi:N-acylglucosamine-6-phosphate 2-epimerase
VITVNRNEQILAQIKGGLIVSCQALKNEPLYSSYIMSRMAVAAKEGGAVGIRANTPEDISEIKKAVDLPIIALYKQDYIDSPIYITPTEREVDLLMEVNPEIIALDATNRLRPDGITLDNFFRLIRKRYPEQLFMADCATVEEGIHAQEIGFDIVGTTLSGYTEDTKGISLPNHTMIKYLADTLTIPLIAEGGIWELTDLKQVMIEKVHSVVIGSAITRPREITQRYIKAMT